MTVYICHQCQPLTDSGGHTNYLNILTRKIKVELEFKIDWVVTLHTLVLSKLIYFKIISRPKFQG